MKIKELHLRNIASIETADIDFEHDLVDIDNNSPSPLFLISGDTGVGKSVILDGISLALYKTTPRLDSVVNPASNTFNCGNGELMSVNSIQQYTRLGISSKSPCYSEVVFEGNDNVVYHAKLELGINRNGAHRDPKWTVKIGDQDWVKVDNKHNQILQAVGLSFQQFSRMAMLAQGQFASFLCGDKKEREEILEQLTNTEMFSRYGLAIKSIFDNTKKEKELAEQKLDTESGHLLTDEEVERLKTQQSEVGQTIEILSKQVSAVDNIILKTTQLNSFVHTLSDANRQLEQTRQIMQTDDYRSRVLLVSDWDSTEQVRNAWTNSVKAESDLAKTKDKMARCHDRFGVLSSHLGWVKSQLDEMGKQLESDRLWLDSKAPVADIYLNSAAIRLRLEQFQKCLNDIADHSQKLKDAESKTSTLAQQEKETLQARKDAEKQVADKQTQIDALRKQQADLNPDDINNQLAECGRQKQLIQRWIDTDVQLTAAKKEIQNLRGDIDNKKVQLKELTSKMNQSREAMDLAKEKYEAALRRYTVMSSSVDDVLKGLRSQLKATHVDTCPLCGQPINHEQLDCQFENLLSPLEQERSDAKKVYDDATDVYNSVKTQYDKLEGYLHERSESLSKQEKQMQADEKALSDSLTTHGFAYSSQISSQLDQSRLDIEQKENLLTQRQSLVNQLTTQINGMQDEKKKLDSTLVAANTKWNEAVSQSQLNRQSIDTLKDQINKATAERDDMSGNISAQIEALYPQWRQDVAQTILSLDRDSSEYMARKTKYETSLTRLTAERGNHDQMDQMRQQLAQRYPDWNLTYMPKQLQQPAGLNEWSTLLTIVANIQGQVDSLEQSISASNDMLQSWYSSSGHNADYLAQLVGRKNDVEQDRDYINKTHAQEQSCKNTIETTSGQIATLRTELGLGDNDPMPEISKLEEAKTALNAELQQAVARHAQAKNLLEVYNQNVARLAQARAELDQVTLRFNRWHLINSHFGGTRFRTLAQTYILRPLLNNANIFLEKITDRYKLTCSEENEKLSILVIDRYNKDAVRSATVLSGGERFMVSLALSLALSSLNKPDMNVNILFIDEGFGTLDEKSLESVISTLKKLPTIAGQSNRRVGIISHREELIERIRTQICITRQGEGRSRVEIVN